MKIDVLLNFIFKYGKTCNANDVEACEEFNVQVSKLMFTYNLRTWRDHLKIETRIKERT